MDINTDYDTPIAIEEDTLSWQKDEKTNVLKKIFSADSEMETSLIKINPDSTYEKSDKINSVEIYVLEGTYTNEFGTYKSGTYLKLPAEKESKIKSDIGCEVFKKINYNQIREEKVIVDTTKMYWSQGHGNLQVMSLSENAALVLWPQGERFIEHSHWGGEEILVLKGTFMDEHGKYKVGTWLRNPHLSKHYPYVEEETIIFVKTGHM